MAGAVLLVVSAFMAGGAQPTPPTARMDNFRESFHGQELVDPYHWLEDSTNSDTRQWIDAQNAYARAMVDPLPIRAKILRRLTEMLRHDQIGAPSQRNGYYYFEKRGAEQDLWSFYRRKMAGGADELLLDPHVLNREHTTSISVFDVSDDGSLVAYGVRQGGQDETDLRLLDVTNHHDLTDHLPQALYRGFAFKKDRRGFYYTLQHREAGQRILYHALGSEASKDVELLGKGFGADTWISPVVSETGRYLLINVQRGWAKGELYFQDLEAGTAMRPLVTGLDAKFDPSFAGDFLFLRTDWKAPKGRILRIDLRDPAQEKWREIVPAGDDSIEDSGVIGGKLFVTHLHNVVSRISIVSLEGTPLGEVATPSQGSDRKSVV